jgi:hypothetical protein
MSCSCGRTFRVPDSKAGATGKCPGCGTPLRVPNGAATAVADPFQNEELFQQLASEPDLMGDLDSSARAKRTPPCPKCGAIYEADVVFCMSCRVNILTGETLEASVQGNSPTRGLASGNELEAEALKMGFWQMTLGVLIRPFTTMEKFGVAFTRSDLLAKITVFYALSFLSIVLVAKLVSGTKLDGGRAAQVAEIERVGRIPSNLDPDWHVAEGFDAWTECSYGWEWRLIGPFEKVEAGKPFTATVEVWHKGRQKPFAGEIRWATTVGSGTGTDSEWVTGTKAAEPGLYTLDITAKTAGATTMTFGMFDKAAGFEHLDQLFRHGSVHLVFESKEGWGWQELANREQRMKELGMALESEKKGVGKFVGAAAGTAGVLGSVLGNVIALLIAAGLFTVAARMLGGGGGFLLMLLTLAYLTGFSNYAQMISLVVPGKLQGFAQIGLLGWGFVLQCIALMKVYDIDLLLALMTTVLAAAAQLFGGAYILMFILKLLGAF